MKAHPCVNCDSRAGMERFENETFAIEHAGASAEVRGLSGWRCRACGEVEFDVRSARRYAAAGDKLVCARASISRRSCGASGSSSG